MNTNNIIKRYMSAKEVCEYLGIGMNSVRKFGKESGAVRKIGNRCIFDREVIDKYLEQKHN